MAACGLSFETPALANPRQICVAVSGGADSLALSLLTHHWGQENAVKVIALTVDHGLRKGSDTEAQQVGAWLNAWGLEHHILPWTDGAVVHSRVQERARDARYALMTQWCTGHGIRHLLLAHHQEDQAETVLMRLKKGSGLLGLAGMARVRHVPLHVSGETGGSVQIVRPLLAVSKAQLRETLRAQGQEWIEDPSNANLAFERVRTRHLLAHLEGEGVSAARLAGAARAIARVRDVLERAAEDVMSTSVSGDCVKRIAAKPFLAAPLAVQSLALARLLAEVGGGRYGPSPDKMTRLLGWMARHKGSVKTDPARTLAGCEVRRTVQNGAAGFRVSAEGPRTSAKNHQKAVINCETALAPSGQTSYIQGALKATAQRLE
ncbi:tRNA lysidine(34) synthetase TilS [Magnetovibrio blakemorei]|uniref:tRNA(Ile)-lysidine synthase n=2 Tax=Magnetovibrio blakemorei TaxID=28181 RepID=A0A1E5QAC7_9PROT|nr:tRNA lysidine(34) synthetase TilS [Magnetovibrio blakemorei]